MVELGNRFVRPASAGLRLALATLDGALAWPHLAEALASVCAGGRPCRRSCGRHCSARRGTGACVQGGDCAFACGSDVTVGAAAFDEPLASSPLASAIELITAAMAAPGSADQAWVALRAARSGGSDLNERVGGVAGPALADIPIRVVLGGRFAPCAHGLANEATGFQTPSPRTGVVSENPYLERCARRNRPRSALHCPAASWCPVTHGRRSSV